MHDLVDLNNTVGLNLPDKRRIQFRKRTTCTPLSLVNHTEVVPWSLTYRSLARLPITPSEQVASMYYGEEERRRQNGTYMKKQITSVLSLIESNITFHMSMGCVSSLATGRYSTATLHKLLTTNVVAATAGPLTRMLSSQGVVLGFPLRR